MAEEYLSFGPFRCDSENAHVWRDKNVLDLPPKVFNVLLYLLRHGGRLVSKEELFSAAWPEMYVGDSVLKSAGLSFHCPHPFEFIPRA